MAKTPETQTETPESEEETFSGSHTARVHGWFNDENGIEHHVTRRDDGRWYVNNIRPEDKAEFMAMDAAVDLMFEAKDKGRSVGWVPGLEGGEAFDKAVGPTLNPEKYGEPEEDDTE